MQINENFYFRFSSFRVEYSHVNKMLWNLISYLKFTDEKKVILFEISVETNEFCKVYGTFLYFFQ